MKASRVCLFVACWIGAGAIAHAQTTRTWNVTSGTWGTTTSWDGGTAASATDPAFFSGAGAGTGVVTVMLEANKTVLGMTFDTGTTTLRGDTTNRILTLGTSGITMNSTAGPVTLGVSGSAVNLQLSGSQTWTNNSGNTFTTIGTVTTAGSSGPVLLTLSGTSTALSSFNAAISGAAGREISITKTGLGLWNLGGNNSYAGTTSVEQGSLRVGNVNGLGSGTGGTVVKDGANLQINTTGTITENISIAGAGIAGGANTSVGALNASIAPGAAVTLSGSISLAANATIAVYGGSANANPQFLTFSNGIGGTGDLTLRSASANNGRATFTLNGTSSYSGNTIFSTQNVSGTTTLQIGNDNALPTSTVLNMAAASPSNAPLGTIANYRLGGFSQTLAGLTGGTGGGSGVTAYSNIVTGGSSALSTLTLAVASGTSYTFAGTLGGAGTDENNLALTKSGDGTQTLTGNNTYTGLTTISGGTLSIGSGGTSGSIAGNVTNNASLVFNRSDSLAYSGTIGGSGSLTKTGAGNLALGGQSTFTGLTTVSAGTLALSGAGALATTGTVAVTGAGAVFDISGATGGRTLGMLTGTVGSVVSLGGNSLTVGDATLGTYAGVISGSGGLTKSGAGTLALTGANTYTGLTTVSGGTLSIGSGTNSGSIAGNITNNASLVFNRSDALTYSGTIDGSGSLTKDGAGNLTLGGQSTFTGDTTILGGRISLGTGNALPTSTVLRFGANSSNRRLDLEGFNQTLAGVDNTAATGGTLIVEAAVDNSINKPATLTLNVASGTSFTFSGLVRDASGGTTSALSITKNGGGTQVFSGAAGNVSYTGATTINAGVLEFSGANSVAATSAITLAGGTVRFSGGGTKSNSIAGSGGLEKTGANLLSLTGANTYTGPTTISGGTLSIGSGTNSGSIAGNITNNASLVFNRSDALTYSGTIGGSGSLTKDGLGNLTLGGQSTFTGDTTILNGRILLGTANALPTSTVLRFGANSSNRRLDLEGFNQTLAGVDSTAATGGTPIVEAAVDNSINKPATLTLNVASGTSFTFSGLVRDAAGGTTSALTITKNGGGTQVFSGTAAYVSYTGATAINAGVLEFSGANSVAANSAITLAGGTVRFSGGGTRSTLITGSGGLEKTGANLLSLTGNNTYTGPTTISGGTLSIGSGGTSGSIAGNITNNAALLFDRSDSLTYSGTIDGSGGLAKSGAGTLALTGANSYTGLTTISGGTLLFDNVNALYGGGTSSWTAANLTTGTGAVVAFTVGSASPQFTSANLDTIVSMQSTGSTGFLNGSAIGINVGDGTSFSYGTAIANPNAGSNALGLVKSGAGTLALTGANTYTGPTTISGGTLSIGNPSALQGTTGVSVADLSTLLYTGGAATFDRNISVNGSAGSIGTVANSGGGLLTLAGTLTKNGTVLKLTGGSFNVTGQIVGTSANSDLVVDAASVTLSNTNSYNGPTFVRNAGTLVLGTNDAIPANSAVSLAGSTLTVGGYTNTIGSLSTSGSSTINVSISGGSTGSIAMGDLSFGGGTNTLALSMTSATAGIYNVLTYSGNKTGSFTTTGVDSNYTVLAGAASAGAIAIQRKADFGTVIATAPTIITGGSAAISYTVANTTPTGGATLSFASANGSNVSGASNGTAAANSTSGTVSGLFFTGTTIGASQIGSFTVQDSNAINTTGTGTVSVTVLDHATSSLAALSVLTSTTISLGTWNSATGQWEVGTGTGLFSIFNIASSYGSTLTADLSLAGLAGGATGYTTNLGTYADITGGTSAQYSISFDPAAVTGLSSGIQSTTFLLSMSDKTGMAGATPTNTLSVTANVVVVPEPGALALAGLGIGVAGWMARHRRGFLRRC